MRYFFDNMSDDQLLAPIAREGKFIDINQHREWRNCRLPANKPEPDWPGGVRLPGGDRYESYAQWTHNGWQYRLVKASHENNAHPDAKWLVIKRNATTRYRATWYPVKSFIESLSKCSELVFHPCFGHNLYGFASWCQGIEDDW